MSDPDRAKELSSLLESQESVLEELHPVLLGELTSFQAFLAQLTPD